jgi:hypothetical protein
MAGMALSQANANPRGDAKKARYSHAFVEKESKDVLF